MGKKGRRDRTSRNVPCPCGSGKKYKLCHEKAPRQELKEKLLTGEFLHRHLKEQEALEIQRHKQQGLGKPIISAEVKGNRFIAVGNELHWSPKWKTFHDFLGNYIEICFGKDWWFGEINKGTNKKHPILKWAQLLSDHTEKYHQDNGEVHTAPMTGAVAAFYDLAYNLYLLSHNVELQTKLVKRLKDQEQFKGAAYETSVAAIFIKAGFDLVFEDETDISTSHCEFTATHIETGKKFSVEAKCRQGSEASHKIGNQLYGALRKRADHTRVVFIELNVPDKSTNDEAIDFIEALMSQLRELEERLKIDGNAAPEAYVFLTNSPYQYSLQSAEFQCFALAEGFKIPEFNYGLVSYNIRDALRIRREHLEMYQLIDSIKEHSVIPSTFDGEIPEIAFGNSEVRLKIGQKYLVPDNTGKEAIGELMEAVVAWDKAIGIYKLQDGQTVMVSCPLTEDELAAYKKYPDTFFGIHKPQGRKAETPLDLFDFFYNGPLF